MDVYIPEDPTWMRNVTNSYTISTQESALFASVHATTLARRCRATRPPTLQLCQSWTSGTWFQIWAERILRIWFFLQLVQRLQNVSGSGHRQLPTWSRPALLPDCVEIAIFPIFNVTCHRRSKMYWSYQVNLGSNLRKESMSQYGRIT